MEPIQPRIPDDNLTEAGSLATELANAYLQMVTFHRDQMHLAPADADQAARGLDRTPEQALEDLVRIRERAPDQVTWADLQRLVNHDPDEMVAAWAHLRAEARAELASGHRTAQTLEWQGRPVDRARFLAIRDSFRGTTPLRNGIEAALVDTAAGAFSDFLHWTAQVRMQAGSEAATERDSLERHGSWSPARLSATEAIEQSATMAERAHKRFLSTIKMLHELQRTSATVFIGNASQINLGQQQVNVLSRSGKRPADLPKSLGRRRLRRSIVPTREAVQET